MSPEHIPVDVEQLKCSRRDGSETLLESLEESFLARCGFELERGEYDWAHLAPAIHQAATSGAVVISHESDNRFRRGILELKNLIDAAFRVGPSVDVVSQENDAALLRQIRNKLVQHCRKYSGISGSKQRLTLLSANDGQAHLKLDADQKVDKKNLSP